MRYRVFGRTGLRVSELLLGTMGFREERQAREIVAAYADAGGNVLDTASAYGDGEELLGRVLVRRDRFVLATKYTLSHDPADPNASGNHRKNLVRSLDRSLRRLRTDHVDLLWVHVWDRHTPVEETLRALDDLVRAGKVLHLGFSDVPAWVVARANALAEWRGWTPFAGIQVPYSLLRRDVERELLPMAEDLGLSVAAWAPLDRGRLAGGAQTSRVDTAGPAGRERAVLAVLHEVAAELGATPARVALAWLRAASPAVLPLIGVSTVAQLADNLGAAGLVLPEPARARLTAATGFERGFPRDFIEECAQSSFVFGDSATKLDTW
ncbi:aryl-alcohol dehydrogenase-like predicted oxidoreductase [Crossiella equi]|uniref:Aryl-alcohol dehydrogenase-like predicted oxidoreductase n=1 Tax=Crossiella equi TaxID=130796 RepID=A0ABS5AT72_9PSEU|nr:aldo/keto reductase [Crossiella equi]MBP2478900.1 aryl-alcohol dehydrogenase-like predicted oxidoreductase [Crossiella equi]